MRATPALQQPRVVPSNSQRTVIASPVRLQSSIAETYSARPEETVSLKAANVVTAVPEPVKKQGSRPFRFGSIGGGKKRDQRPSRRPARQDRKRFDVPLFRGSKSKPSGGSTIVPITVTGTGLAKPTTLHRRVTPSEVVVTANQGFASLSIIDRFTNAIGPKPNQNNDHDDLPSLPKNYAFNPDPIVVNDGLPPTGLVTTLGGTIVSAGLTTVHETSVIGTYIKGQYAQVLLSTSRIFQSSTAVGLLQPGYETVKSVIKGSATKFISPERTAALPLEALFSSPNDRSARLDDPVLFKRRGPTRSQFGEDPYVDGLSEDDLQRSGTDLKPSFRPVASVFRRNNNRATANNNVHATTFRPRFTPASSYRFGETRTKTHRTSPPRDRKGQRPFIRRRPSGGGPPNRQKLVTNRKNNFNVKKDVQTVNEEASVAKPTPTLPESNGLGEETLKSHKSQIPNGLWVEIATVRSMHTFRVGTKKNTRFVTFTRTSTHAIEPTAIPTLENDSKFSASTDNSPQQKQYIEDDLSLSPTPLFENILDESKHIATLPPIDIGENNLNALLQTVTESLSTTETMLKTSVLPVMKAQQTLMHTLTQTYLITRIVTAIRTIPPVEAFDFIPENSLNEFNDKLLAEGTENEQSLLPGEVEYDENSGTRVKPPPGFRNQDPALAELVGGQFNPDVLEQKLNPALSAALRGGSTPQLTSGLTAVPESFTQATPQLSPEQLQQLAYLQLMNPYAFGGFPALQPQVSVTSSPVTVTTDVTTTTTRVLRVIFNARPIYTTLTSTEVVRTTLTTYELTTVTATHQRPFGGFPFPGMPFPAG